MVVEVDCPTVGAEPDGTVAGEDAVREAHTDGVLDAQCAAVGLVVGPTPRCAHLTVVIGEEGVRDGDCSAVRVDRAAGDDFETHLRVIPLEEAPLDL